ncbi:MAG: twin-arginine translocase TatA/TatE family subunit [Chloroflexota bacterium]|nr:twin-arginine translocase TatA/TatE family subunit [Chloroflexota bacterium]
MDLFGIGPMELIVVLVLAFLFLGPNKLGDVAKGLGKAMREIRRNVSEVTRAIEDDAPPTAPNQREPSPNKPDDITGGLGSAMREIRRSVNEVTRAIKDDAPPKPAGSAEPKAVDVDREPPEEKR